MCDLLDGAKLKLVQAKRLMIAGIGILSFSFVYLVNRLWSIEEEPGYFNYLTLDLIGMLTVHRWLGEAVFLAGKFMLKLFCL